MKSGCLALGPSVELGSLRKQSWIADHFTAKFVGTFGNTPMFLVI
jgi:hypothetical protein